MSGTARSLDSSAAANRRSYSASGTLRDGTLIDVREIRSDDKSQLLEHFRSLIPEIATGPRSFVTSFESQVRPSSR